MAPCSIWSFAAPRLYHVRTAGDIVVERLPQALRIMPAGEQNVMSNVFGTGRPIRRHLISLWLVIILAACDPAPDPGDYAEHDIDSLQALMQQGELTSEQLTRYYLDRIDAVDRHGPMLNSIIEVNPDAVEIAAELDAERQATGSRGPLHGIPVVLKANIDTADAMETTAGSLAMKGHRPPADAFLVESLRAAGAVILAKANLSEWANFRSTNSSSGWSSIGGQTNNPYGVMRNPCGSSSGSAVAVAASLTSVAVGTETNGSIVCPSSVNGIVGIKPSLGLVRRSGIIQPRSKSRGVLPADLPGRTARGLCEFGSTHPVIPVGQETTVKPCGRRSRRLLPEAGERTAVC